MSHLKQKHKDYLIKNEIKDLTDLVNYVEILRNTSILQGENRQMLFDFAWLIIHDIPSLNSFFAENKNPSKEFYNAFKKSTSSPTFMDEVLDSANSTRHKSKEVETHTEVPDFEINYYFKDEQTKPEFKVVKDLNPEYIECKFNFTKEEIGKKETENKINYEELDWDYIDGMSLRMSKNLDKYPSKNWQKKMDIKKLAEASIRHARKIIQEIENDEETLQEHAIALGCNGMMINYQLKNYVK